MLRKSGKCPHCGKEFRISRRMLSIYIPAVFFILFLADFFLLGIPDMNLIFLISVTSAGIVIAYFLMPFAIKFTAISSKKEKIRPMSFQAQQKQEDRILKITQAPNDVCFLYKKYVLPALF